MQEQNAVKKRGIEERKAGEVNKSKEEGRKEGKGSKNQDHSLLNI